MKKTKMRRGRLHRAMQLIRDAAHSRLGKMILWPPAMALYIAMAILEASVFALCDARDEFRRVMGIRRPWDLKTSFLEIYGRKRDEDES